VLGVNGEIDLATIPRLHDALSRWLASTPEGSTVFVDIDGVYACDDTGLGVLLGAAGRVRQAGGDLVVVCSAGPMRDRLNQTRFDRAVKVVPGLAEMKAPADSGD